MKKTLILLIFTTLSLASFAQSKTPKLIGGGCEGCELYTEGMPKKLSWQTTMAQNEKGVKIHISGFIFKKDGKTPAPNVILYIYHTDNDGLYSASPTQKVAKRHGRLRGWMKTDSLGRYAFTTIRPASYPNTKFLAHIHPTIKEPNKNEYYIDDFVFSDDPFLTVAEKKKMPNRGGNGIVTLTLNADGTSRDSREGVFVGQRNLVLGLNIPNY
jgi:protocatechuate 3,4-dioxygenase, beta subunit